MPAAVSHEMPSGSLTSGAAGDQAFGAIGAERVDKAGVGDAIADGNFGHAGPDRLDHARGLDAHAGRQRHRVQTSAEVGVGEVQADCLMAQADLSRTGLAHFDVLIAQDLRTAGFMEAHCFCHGSFS